MVQGSEFYMLSSEVSRAPFGAGTKNSLVPRPLDIVALQLLKTLLIENPKNCLKLVTTRYLLTVSTETFLKEENCCGHIQSWNFPSKIAGSEKLPLVA